jgi:exosortase
MLHLGLVAAILAALLWDYWPTARELARAWYRDPRYAHGAFVPAFALYYLWTRRRDLGPCACRPSGWGFGLICLGAALRLSGAFLYADWLNAASLLPSLAGLCVLAGGWAALRRAWPAIAFLVFMIPLPYRLEVALANPLQRVATASSVYALQALEVPALADDTLIRILGSDAKLEVSEACSGLGMLVSFVALATAFAMTGPRRLEERALLVLSAVPIALMTNIARVVLTGVAQFRMGGTAGHAFYHDLAGWVMMPLAVLFMCICSWIISRLFVDVPTASVPGPQWLGRAVVSRVPPSSAAEFDQAQEETEPRSRRVPHVAS